MTNVELIAIAHKAIALWAIVEGIIVDFDFIKSIDVTLCDSRRTLHGYEIYGYYDEVHHSITVFTMDYTDKHIAANIAHELVHAIQFNTMSIEEIDYMYNTYEYDDNPLELAAAKAELFVE